MDKALVFIDAGYFSKALTALGKPKIDFAKFSDMLCQRANSERLRTYYYDCMPYQGGYPTEEEKERYAAKREFISKLNRLPRFEVRLGRLSKSGDSFKQKGIDTLLSIDLTRLAWRGIIQKAILITGDSDFAPAVKEAKFAGVIVQIYYLKSKFTSAHDELLEAADEQFEISKELLSSVIRS